MAAPSPSPSRERLWPMLLDRLTDEAPAQPDEADPSPAQARLQLRRAVLRDLRWLFNACQPHPQWAGQQPLLAGSTLNFGLPPLAGHQLSRLDLRALERSIQQAIRQFEPRLLADTLEVRAVEPDLLSDSHNRIQFEIRGQLYGHPEPQDVVFHSWLDLEAGQVDLVDGSATTTLRQP